MFQPNTFGLWSKLTGTNAYGETTWARAKKVACAVVGLEGQLKKTSVRADSSASRGSADEKVSVAKLLFPVVVKPKIGDRFEFNGMKLRFILVQPRYAVTGVLDHYECEFEAMP